VNPSYYCFDAARAVRALERVERNELTGEYYVTDVPELLLKAGERVEVIDAVPPEDILSINTLEHLAEVDAIYRARLSASPGRREREGRLTMGESRGMRIFAGRNSKPLAEKVCRHMGMPLGDARTQVFPDGELLVKLEEDVRGRDCFVISSTCAPVNDNLMELLIFIDCLRRASARRTRSSCRTSGTPGRTARARGACRSPRSWSRT
jgi:hypothetical protein